MVKPGIRVDGLGELRKALRKLQHLDDLAELRAGLKDAAGIVADEAKSRVPVRSGRARGSIRPSTSGAKAFVIGGKASVPYYGWLDFGSRSPRSGNPRSRGPWSGAGKGPEKGRFIYPAIDDKEAAIVDAVGDAVDKALRKIF